jgi:hypothetical protein
MKNKTLDFRNILPDTTPTFILGLPRVLDNSIFIFHNFKKELLVEFMRKKDLTSDLNLIIQDFRELSYSNVWESQRNAFNKKEAEHKELLLKLNQIKNLEFNWNGNKAEAFSEEVCNRAKLFLNKLKECSYAVSVFPTACNSIQFEAVNQKEEYIEAEVFEDKIMLYTESDDKTREFFDIAEVATEFIKKYYA